MSDQQRLTALNAKIKSLRGKRKELKAQAARRRERHQSIGGLQTQLEAMTLAQLRAELGLERQKMRGIKPTHGRGRAAVRKRAEKIKEKIEERQSL